MTTDIMRNLTVCSSSTWSDALDRAGVQGVVHGLRHVTGALPFGGRAVTVRQETAALGTHPGEAFDVPAILAAVSDGDVLVIDLGGAPVSSFGGLAARAAARRGLAGVLVDGGCRDVDEIQATGLGVCSRHITPLSGKRRIRTLEINGAIACGGVSVRAGDFIVADATGIVVVPANRYDEVLAIARDIDRRDRAFAQAIGEGGDFKAIARSLGHL